MSELEIPADGVALKSARKPHQCITVKASSCPHDCAVHDTDECPVDMEVLVCQECWRISEEADRYFTERYGWIDAVEWPCEAARLASSIEEFSR